MYSTFIKSTNRSSKTFYVLLNVFQIQVQCEYDFFPKRPQTHSAQKNGKLALYKVQIVANSPKDKGKNYLFINFVKN